MKWAKRGLIADRGTVPGWATYSALTPTPVVLNDDVLRIYAGFRDGDGVSRIGFIDLDAKNPQQIIAVSEKPALDIGRPGMFDDNGVILGDIIRIGDAYRMYYVGFQKVQKAKFLAFSGMATSVDGGETFTRHSEAPVLDRADGALFINAIHTVMPREQGGFLAWVAQGNGWEIRNGIPYPQYDIWERTSADGIRFDNPSRKLIALEGDEYRIGRPSVFRRPDGGFGMFYTRGYISSNDYKAGIAFSPDGSNWTRMDEQFGLVLGTDNDFDSRHLCYPRLFEAHGKVWAIYNGNDMGAAGFGLAELLEW